MKKRVISFLLFVLVVTFTIAEISRESAIAMYENTYTNTGNQREDIIGVALTQLGNSTGSEYTFGAGNVSWCAYFVVWCARQAEIDSSVIKLNGYATADDLGVEYRGRSADRTVGIEYTPKRGDLIFFDWESNGFCYKSPPSFYGDHVGIVEYVSDGYVHTIEGNSSYMAGSTGPETGTCVRKRAFSLNSEDIKGYGIPNYKNNSMVPDEPTAQLMVNRETIKSKNSIIFSFGGNNCGIFSLNIYKNEELVTTKEIRGTSCELGFSDPGIYSAYCLAYVDDTCQSYVKSETVHWEVVSDLSPGDINGDGAVNNKDLTRFMKYLSGESVSVSTVSLDINGDGAINNKDLTRLLKYLAGETVILY